MNWPRVSITIVTFNSARFVSKCLRHVFEQQYPDFEVIVVDNASVDETLAMLGEFEPRVRVLRNPKNVGFAVGQNQAIAASKGDWVLTLNPDVRVTADFLREALTAAHDDPAIGSVSGKLLRMSADFEIPENKILDSTGIYFTPALRHFDRGSSERDLGAYADLEYMFGVTGAAALYRRRMIQDVSIAGEFFDGDFFAYREDADLAWRAQLYGWKCLYAPRAIAYHVRNVLPSNRRELSAVINMHSVKNRFLMRIKNITGGLYSRYFFAITFRDLVVLGGCLLHEWSSLRAFAIVLGTLPKTLRKRREIMRKRRVDSTYIANWFRNTPVSLPVVTSLHNKEAVAPR